MPNLSFYAQICGGQCPFPAFFHDEDTKILDLLITSALTLQILLPSITRLSTIKLKNCVLGREERPIAMRRFCEEGKNAEEEVRKEEELGGGSGWWVGKIGGRKVIHALREEL